MFATICNGLINMGGAPICIDEEVSREDLEKAYENTYYSGDEFTEDSDEDKENVSDMCGW
jgi:hypothetical protein